VARPRKARVPLSSSLITDSAEPQTTTRTGAASGSMRDSSYSRCSTEGISGECASRYGSSSSTSTGGTSRRAAARGSAASAARNAASHESKRIAPGMPSSSAATWSAKRRSAGTRDSSNGMTYSPPVASTRRRNRNDLPWRRRPYMMPSRSPEPEERTNSVRSPHSWSRSNRTGDLSNCTYTRAPHSTTRVTLCLHQPGACRTIPTPSDSSPIGGPESQVRSTAQRLRDRPMLIRLTHDKRRHSERLRRVSAQSRGPSVIVWGVAPERHAERRSEFVDDQPTNICRELTAQDTRAPQPRLPTGPCDPGSRTARPRFLGCG